MALLPDEQRTAIILKEYHGMTFQEIADMQGVSVQHREDAALSGTDRALVGSHARAFRMGPPGRNRDRDNDDV